MRSSRMRQAQSVLDREESTDVARVELTSGSFDALRAIHFSRRFPPHFHETFAVGVVESGLTRLRTLRGEWVATTGTILAFSPGEIHSAEPLTEEGLTYRMIYPSNEFMRGIVANIERPANAPLFRAPVIEDRELGAELAQAHLPLMEGASSNSAEWRLVAAMRRLVSRHGADATEMAAFRPVDLHVVALACEYLRSRFAEQVRLRTLAAECGLDPFRLIRIFRRVVGVPPYAYLVQVRVNRAQAMLCAGATVAEVAYSCGFSDQAHLTRTFKRAVGVPPGQYVRSVRSPAA